MKRFERSSGVLLHPTALPGKHGIGSLGDEALKFLDWLADAGQSYWQICPLVPTGYGDSPYQGFSAFAGNPNLISLENLKELRLLDETDLKPFEALPKKHVDFGSLIPLKKKALDKAWQRFQKGGGPAELKAEYSEFKQHASSWLNDFALFMVLKDRHGGNPWNLWDEEYRLRDSDALARLANEAAEETDSHSFSQFLFFRQWEAVKKAAGDKGIGIIGDLPIFISFDSSDCWANPHLFQLDEERKPLRVAGVPPDYFSETGQLWGNPLYNWNVMKKNRFSWWISVLRDKLEHYDVLRIDHFRGFSAYWSVPYGEKTAVNGEWIPAPGKELFAEVRKQLGDVPIIAEDLGVITEDVVELISGCGFPGMKVLQFAFDSSEENDYLPHNYGNHCLVYTGTHDNDTSVGWFNSARESDRRTTRDYLGLKKRVKGKEVARALIRAALASVADVAITPFQDILGLGSEARFNTPGTLGGNWTWRASADSFDPNLAASLRKTTEIYGRRNNKEKNRKS